MLQEKANSFATRFGILDFNCSASWISRFKVRHNVVAEKIVGDSSSVDQNSTTNWLTSVWPNGDNFLIVKVYNNTCFPFV